MDYLIEFMVEAALGNTALSVLLSERVESPLSECGAFWVKIASGGRQSFHETSEDTLFKGQGRSE